MSSGYKDSCVLVITLAWLGSTPPDMAIELAGRSVYQAGRTDDSGKSKVEECACTLIMSGAHLQTSLNHVAPLTLNIWQNTCRPFDMLRRFTFILITAVFIPAQANAKLALEELHAPLTPR